LEWDVSWRLYHGELTKTQIWAAKADPRQRGKNLSKQIPSQGLADSHTQQCYQGKAHMSEGATHFFPPIKSDQKAQNFFLPPEAYNSQTILTIN
jgi:hypothetical protein